MKESPSPYTTRAFWVLDWIQPVSKYFDKDIFLFLQILVQFYHKNLKEAGTEKCFKVLSRADSELKAKILSEIQILKPEG